MGAKERIRLFEVVEPVIGGTPKHVAMVCAGLSADAFEITVVYPERRSAPLLEGLPSTVEQIRVPMAHEISLVEDCRSFYTLWRLFSRRRPHIVHAHSSKAGFLARWAAALARVPVVIYTPHAFAFLREDVGAGSRRLFRMLEKLCAPVTDALVAVSDAEAREAAQVIAPRKILVNPNGVTLPEAAASRPSDTVLIGTSGRLAPQRAPEVFFRVAREVCRRRREGAFLWIGGGELEGEVRAALKADPPPGSIDITGWLEPGEADSRVNELAVYVMTSKWEGLPYSLLEAMAWGKPAVVLNRAGLAEVVRHGETGFVAQNEAEMIGYLERLVDDADLRRRMGMAARRHVETRFSADAMLGRLADFYARTVRASFDAPPYASIEYEK